MFPLVSIVGRPNVGKSTLVNRLISSQEAIVESEPGITRDRNYYEADWQGIKFRLIDTGGLDPLTSDELSQSIGRQAIHAARESDLILFLVDAADGVTPLDLEIAESLRPIGKPVLLVLNKADNRKIEEGATPEFYQLGLGDPIPISALHGLGIGELLDRVISHLPAVEEEEKAGEGITIAILGRPNVGKSSIFNRLIGEERSITCDIPGTTRDPVDTEIAINGKRYIFADTAGWRRRNRLSDKVEYYSLVRVWRTLDRSEVALLVIDASEGVTDQDQKIAARIREDGLASVVLLNKWDLVRKRPDCQDLLLDAQEKLHFISYSTFIRTSALTGLGMGKILPAVEEAHANWSSRIQTAQLNRLREELVLKSPPPSMRGRHLHIYYVVQARTAPPEFVFFVNDKRLVTQAYARFLERRLRETFTFSGSPIRIVFRGKKNRQT